MPFKFNPLTGKLDLVDPNEINFSYIDVELGKELTIPSGQQMIVYEALNLDGDLVINGELVIFNGKVLSRIIDTDVSETINIEVFEVVRQTVSGITTSFSSVSRGSQITVTNRSGGDNTLNITIQGTASPTIKDRESFSLIYNGIDYDFT